MLDEEPLTVGKAAKPVKKRVPNLSEARALKESKILLPQLAASGKIIQLAANRQSLIYLSRSWMAKQARTEAGEDLLSGAILAAVGRLQSISGSHSRSVFGSIASPFTLRSPLVAPVSSCRIASSAARTSVSIRTRRPPSASICRSLFCVSLAFSAIGSRRSAALLHFGSGPQAEQIVFSGPSIEQARPKLIALIGALAGVTRTGREGKPIAGSAQESSWPRKPGEDEIEKANKLVRALSEYGAEAQLSGEPLVGPTFVRYLLQPQRGVPVNRIEKCGGNLQVRLELECEPVIHRAEGRIAVDVQRRHREYVPFGSLRAAFEENIAQRRIARVLAGVDLRGKVHFLDVASECPHILVGGHAGSGKTEWLRTAVASLISTITAETLRLAIIDPKKNAFFELAGSPFLWRHDALIDSPDALVLTLLDDVIQEMSRRYELFKKVAADDLTQYRQKTQEALPRLICVVDEFAELLSSGGRKQRDDFEQGFIRIAAVGRAAGVHLILATQRPSRQVVSGNLKANLPGKIAMRVSNRIDSGVLIDQKGAELLLGKGDLLLAGLSSEPVRLQSAWLSEEERQAIFGETLRFTSAPSPSTL